MGEMIAGTTDIYDKEKGIKVVIRAIASEEAPNTLNPDEPRIFRVSRYEIEDIIFSCHETDTTRIKKLLELVQEIAGKEGIGKEDVYTEECMGVNYYQTFNEIISILLNHLEYSRKIKECPKCGLKMMLRRSVWECDCGFRMV